MTRIKQQAVQFTALETAQLVEVQADDRPLDAQEVTGRTLKTLISSGTELACYQGQLCNTTFPMQPGYAAVFQIKEIGGDVTAFKPGDLAFCMGPHRSFQRAAQQDALQLPPGLPPEVAVFARLMGVSMSTLTTTTARPPAIVLVSGLGPVGHLAAKIFHRCGYEVIAVDPIDSRRALLKNSGIERVFPRVPLDDSSIAKQVAAKRPRRSLRTCTAPSRCDTLGSEEDGESTTVFLLGHIAICLEEGVGAGLDPQRDAIAQAEA